MIDLHEYRSRENMIRKMIGIRERSINDAEMFSIYYNPSNGRITGIRDNERNKFYHHTQQDIIQFVSMINQREFHTSHFLQSIELEFKKYVDRDIEKHEHLSRMFDEKMELQKQLNQFIKLAEDYNLTLDGLYDAFEELLEKKFKGVE